MARIIVALLACMVLVFLGYGSSLAAPMCPIIGSETGEEWSFSTTLIGYCSNVITHPLGLEYPITKSGTWKFYQQLDDCFFYAERKVTYADPNYYMGESTVHTGLIYDNGRITMQAKPSQDNPPGTYFGEITKYGKGKRALEIKFIGNAALGDYDVTPAATAPSCAFTSKGIISR